MIIIDKFIVLQDSSIQSKESHFFPLDDAMKVKDTIKTTTQIRRGAIYTLQGAMIDKDDMISSESFVLYICPEEDTKFKWITIQVKYIEEALKKKIIQMMV